MFLFHLLSEAVCLSQESSLRGCPGFIVLSVTWEQAVFGREWLAFLHSPWYPPKWLLKLDSMARVTCPGPSAASRLGPSLATGQRPSDHAGPGGPGPAQPMGWRHPHDPRREGVGRQAGNASRRAESPPPPLPGREVSRRGPQCKPAGERVP